LPRHRCRFCCSCVRPKIFPGLLAAYGSAQGGQFGLLFTGMKLGMPAGISVVLQTQAFITMLLAAALLGEKPQRWQWIGLTSPCRTAADRCSPWRGAIQMTLIGFVLTVGPLPCGPARTC
jgi:O-acetylserine/cysteine efflux transporter